MTVIRPMCLLLAIFVLTGYAVEATTIPSLPFVERTPQNIRIEIFGGNNKTPSGGVVLMHDCGGYGVGNIKDWAEWYIDRGYVAVGVDSFSTRGIDNLCDGSKLMMRVGDSYAAANHLVADDYGELDQDCQPSSRARQERADALIAAGVMAAGDPFAILFDRENAALPILRNGNEDGNDGYTLASAVFEITAEAVDWKVCHGPDPESVASGHVARVSAGEAAA